MLSLMSFLSLFTLSIVLIGIWSPNAFASVDWGWRIDRHVGSTFVDVVACGVFLWFSFFGDGAEVPDVVDKLMLFDSLDTDFSFVVFPGMLDLSVCRLNPRVLLHGRKPVFRPADLARLWLGWLGNCVVLDHLAFVLSLWDSLVSLLFHPPWTLRVEAHWDLRNVDKVLLSARICMRHNHLTVMIVRTRRLKS